MFASRSSRRGSWGVGAGRRQICLCECVIGWAKQGLYEVTARMTWCVAQAEGSRSASAAAHTPAVTPTRLPRLHARPAAHLRLTTEEWKKRL